MPHPLKKISTRIKATGHYLKQIDTTDQYGNPVVKDTETPVELELMLKPNGKSKFSTQPSGKIINLYDCFILTDNINLSALANEILLEDGKNLYILNKTQAVLKPINKVFGQRFSAYTF